MPRPKGKDKVIISLNLSKDLVEVLKVVSNKSKLIEDILSSLILDLSTADMFQLIKIMTEKKDVVEFLIRKKCEKLGINLNQDIQDIQDTKDTHIDTKKEEPIKTVKKKKINPDEWWG